MTKYKIKFSKAFKRAYKKIKYNRDLSELLQEIIIKLANDEKLDAKYNDHNLKRTF